MEQSVVIRYVTGTKGSAVEQIPIAGRQELIAGRAPSCDIRYDLDADSLVSRRHMKIEIGGTDEPEFTAVDLQSRNGTFINKSRIRQPSRLKPGDWVQLGTGGPEFVFDIDPGVLQKPGANETMAYDILSKLAALENTCEPRACATKRRKKWTVAAALLLLMTGAVVLGPRTPLLAEISQKSKSAWAYISAQGTTFANAAVDSGRSLYRKVQVSFGGRKPTGKTTPQQAAAAMSAPTTAPPSGTVNIGSLANLEVRWILSDSRSGRRVRQVYIANLPVGASEGSSPLIPEAGKSLPLFVLLADNRLQPVLTVSDEDGGRPISGTYRNAGFRASAIAVMPPNDKATTPWASPYEWPPDVKAGVVAKFDKHHKLISSAVIARRQFPKWRPADSPFILAETLNAPLR